MGSLAGFPPTLTAPLGSSCTKTHAIARVAGLSATRSQCNAVVVRSSTRVVRAERCRAPAGKVRSIIGMGGSLSNECLQLGHTSKLGHMPLIVKGAYALRLGEFMSPGEGEDDHARSR